MRWFNQSLRRQSRLRIGALDGLLSKLGSDQSYPGAVGLVPTALDAVLFLGLIGIYYPGWGRVLAWLSCAVALARFCELKVHPSLIRNVLLLLGSLALISALSAYPYHSVRAVVDIGLGFCMFLPGALFGRRLLVRPFQPAPLLLACLFALIHLAFPVTYLERLSYGFFDNPNLNGRGLAYLVLLLGILQWSFMRPSRPLPISGAAFKGVLVLFGCAYAGNGFLLVLTNYRTGWLAVCTFFVLSCFLLARVATWLKLALSATLCSVLVGLVLLVDEKGFGYGSVGERSLMWGCSFKSWIHQYFWFGSGFDSFKNLRLPCLPESAIGIHAYPHHVFIELLLSAGIAGFACVFIFVAAQLRLLIRAGCFRSPVAVAALCAVLGLMLSSLLGMKFASFTYVGSLSALVGIIYSQCLLPNYPLGPQA